MHTVMHTSDECTHMRWLCRLSKNRKKRGHVSAGNGRVGKHRKHPGGRGNAGAQHHHRINTLKYHPGYLGKNGMRHYREQKCQTACPTVNVDRLWTMMSEEDQQKYSAGSAKPTIDVTRAGIFKVLGHGAELKHAMIVRARYFSKLAREEIEKAGGECQTLLVEKPAVASA